ncbi:MAG TPA: hypothetical protein PLL26_03770 [Candidatus Dojkabacteria bacterium]|nr:hypothetical protein [Candidatus Dojkabacteria bacterium]
MTRDELIAYYIQKNRELKNLTKPTDAEFVKSDDENYLSSQQESSYANINQ